MYCTQTVLFTAESNKGHSEHWNDTVTGEFKHLEATGEHESMMESEQIKTLLPYIVLSDLFIGIFHFSVYTFIWLIINSSSLQPNLLKIFEIY